MIPRRLFLRARAGLHVRMNARLASALLVLSACTVYRVPEDADSDAGQSSGGSKGA